MARASRHLAKALIQAVAAPPIEIGRGLAGRVVAAAESEALLVRPRTDVLMRSAAFVDARSARQPDG